MLQWLTTTQAGRLLLTLLISAVPVIELRGAVQFTVEKLGCSQASVYRYIKNAKAAEEQKNSPAQEI